MKTCYFLLLALIIVSCTDSKPETNILPEDIEKPKRMMNESEVKRHIESQLKILGTEKYNYTVYKEHLDADDSVDQIITVNLLDRALNEAIGTKQVAKRAEFGYMGNFNYIFYVDGKTKSITSPIVVPSSAQAELKVSFENITTEAYKDFMIDLKIQNSCFRRFYTVWNQVPFQTSETELYTDLGMGTEKIYAVSFEPSLETLAKNIVITVGKTRAVKFTHPDEVYSYEPKIESTGEFVRRWYFSSKHMKYYLKNDEI